MPKTPGYLRSALYIYDPDRVSLLLTITITSDPWRGRGIEGYDFPGSSGLRPSDTRAMKNAPLPGCITVTPAPSA